MRKKSLWFTLSCLGVGVFVACSADPPRRSSRNSPQYVQGYEAVSFNQESNGRHNSLQYDGPVQSPSSIYRDVNVERDYLPYGSRGRSRKGMTPRYITIHSTQNWSKGADARRHALALKRGALGRLSWHYTTDENRAVQHLPTNEQGNHADHDGPGNRYSIGIEMCEHPGNSRAATLERTAKLL